MDELPSLPDFRALLTETFYFRASDGVPHPFTLVEAEALRADDDPRRVRAPYSLVFHATSRLAFSQGRYRVEHRGTGEIELFCVPLTPTASGPVLQAIVA